MSKNTYSEKIKEKLLKLISKEQDAKVVALKGEWGCGKSHFWKNFVKDEHYNNAYVSLYGLKSIVDIENSIFLQISQRKQISDFLNKKLGFMKDIDIYGINAKSILSTIEPDSFKDIVVCLDDFKSC